MGLSCGKINLNIDELGLNATFDTEKLASLVKNRSKFNAQSKQIIDAAVVSHLKSIGPPLMVRQTNDQTDKPMN